MTTIIEIQEEIDQLDGWLKTGVVDEATYKKRREPLMAELILETEKVERENARLAATKEAEELVTREQEKASAALGPKASIARKDDTVEKLKSDTKVKKAEHTTRNGIVGWSIILGVGYFAWTGISGAIGWATGDAATDVAETTRPVGVVVAKNETTSAITKPQPNAAVLDEALDFKVNERPSDTTGFAKPPSEYADGAEWVKVSGLREDRRGFFSAMCSWGAWEFGDQYSEAHNADKPSKRSPYLEIYNSGSRYFIREEDGKSGVFHFKRNGDLIIVGQWFPNGQPFPGKHGNVVPRCSANDVASYVEGAHSRRYFDRQETMSERNCKALSLQVSAVEDYRRSGAPIEVAFAFGDVASGTDIRLRQFMSATVKAIYEGDDLSQAVADGRWTKACSKWPSAAN